jgi:hypothetical protein
VTWAGDREKLRRHVGGRPGARLTRTRGPGNSERAPKIGITSRRLDNGGEPVLGVGTKDDGVRFRRGETRILIFNNSSRQTRQTF